MIFGYSQLEPHYTRFLTMCNKIVRKYINGCTRTVNFACRDIHLRKYKGKQRKKKSTVHICYESDYKYDPKQISTFILVKWFDKRSLVKCSKPKCIIKNFVNMKRIFHLFVISTKNCADLFFTINRNIYQSNSLHYSVGTVLHHHPEEDKRSTKTNIRSRVVCRRTSFCYKNFSFWKKIVGS